MTNTLTKEIERPIGDLQDERQLVALHLSSEVYGVDIDHIHTIIIPQPITKVPKAPEFVKGVMNLRGRIIPVIDLRSRFDLPELAAEKRKGVRIVIVEVDGLTAGLIVDAVSEVLRLPVSAIDAPSSLVASADMECITGIGRVSGFERNGDTRKEHLIILLDVTKTLTRNLGEAKALKALSKAA